MGASPAEALHVEQTKSPEPEQQEVESSCRELDSCDSALGAKTATDKNAALKKQRFERERLLEIIENSEENRQEIVIPTMVVYSMSLFCAEKRHR